MGFCSDGPLNSPAKLKSVASPAPEMIAVGKGLKALSITCQYQCIVAA